MPFSSFRRMVAAVLILTLTPMLAVTPVASASNAALAGRVFQADGVTPRTDVVVTLVQQESQESFSSMPTTDEGTFNIDSAPAGDYSLIAETPDGAFLAAESIALVEGENRPVSLALTPAQGASSGSAQKGGLPTWGKWVIAGVIIVGGLVLINEVTKDEEEPASTF